MMQRLFRPQCFTLLRRTSARAAAVTSRRHFIISPTAARARKSLPPRPKPPPEDEIEEFYLKGSGPGGQKINKTNSAVQLRHKPTGIVVKSQATRSRDQNRKEAREILARKVDELLNGEQSRSAMVGRIKQKRAASADKKKRRKYRKLIGEQEDDKEPASAEVTTGDNTIDEARSEKPDESRSRGMAEDTAGKNEQASSSVANTRP
ncbi:putative peptide chain release factor-like protein-like protein [Hapsidospora chrysogenum ATCC 11550]|uniref:Putative peptide chain release factor-like protein-like protein n=1 Tax=Hapsidospora chrysogenum (strain ATCC 11550 / CBS 779.69 / DSM 880 / IAM 14645 / JCM 23072 / IMI 49137) TaxID=857340 RepID=A0A086ST23_HAPC1|nr:putative peptide chain release factor-like protein-like protein [Hapsidospora chrysogenum ATCC 11550]